MFVVRSSQIGQTRHWLLCIQRWSQQIERVPFTFTVFGTWYSRVNKIEIKKEHFFECHDLWFYWRKDTKINAFFLVQLHKKVTRGREGKSPEKGWRRSHLQWISNQINCIENHIKHQHIDSWPVPQPTDFPFSNSIVMDHKEKQCKLMVFFIYSNR